jgi:Kef-type K+ transport system membrane component KefB
MKLLSSDDFALSELGWGTAFLALCIGSKLIPLMIAGRWIGLSRPESLLLGLLLNTRGLMELVILSVGLSSGIFSPVQYSIFVMVTVATTLMSTPLSRLVQRRLEPSKDT